VSGRARRGRRARPDHHRRSDRCPPGRQGLRLGDARNRQRRKPDDIGTDAGGEYSVFFYSCVSGKDCRSIQFSTGYTDPYTIEKANEWNTKYRWIKSYESDHTSNFRMDVDFKGGITRAYLDTQFETWNSLIVDIRDFVAKQ